MAQYIHLDPNWPAFRWDDRALIASLAEVRFRQGQLSGRLSSLGFPLQQEGALTALTEEIVRSSEIEDERLDPDIVRSSIARRLGMEFAATKPADRAIDGIVEMTLDATSDDIRPLTVKRLLGWHASLFPSGRSGFRTIRSGAWRDGPMQVVSGPVGREQVHFEAPEAQFVDGMMGDFLAWFETPEPIDPILKAGVAHLWFVTIHPFDDGNGRIARAIADLALTRSSGGATRFFSMSAQILRERRTYYDLLERTQRGTLDVTAWLSWFVDCLGRAIDQAERELRIVFAKSRLLADSAGIPLNARQKLVLSRLLEGFEGNLTTSKWAKIAKASQDTALRDISDLVLRGILVRNPVGGRETSYSLAADWI